jgi:hypothetical protein|tara:strand:+ start:452 stop:808 length:357 start_codon:yes stop_codon:yes gene_type:complete
MNENYAPGSLIGQLQDLSASAQLAYSATLQTEIQHICVCNTKTAAARFSIFHDDGGNRFSAGTALFFKEQINGLSSVLISADDPGTGLTVAKGGSVGVEADKTAAVTFSIYGTTQRAR